MTSLQVAEKKEKSLGEILIVVVLVALLMMTFIFYFFKHQGQLTNVGFESLTNVFSARVNGIRAQWFMDNQPKYVLVDSNNTNNNGKIKVFVNKKGWVDSSDILLKCQNIWSYAIEAPLTYMNEPISAVLVQAQSIGTSNLCRYTLTNGAFFTYQMNNGNVSSLQIPY